MDTAPLELRDYLSLLWRRKWMITAIAAVSVGAALIYSFRQTPVYISSAEVIVRPARFDPNQPRAAFGWLNMTTEKRVANSSQVARLAQEKLRAASITPGQVTATQTEEDSDTLLFTAVAPGPAAAQASAQRWAEAYLELRRDQLLRDLEAAREPFDEQLAAIDRELEEIAIQLASETDEAQRSLMNARYSALLTERSETLRGRSELISPQGVQVGEVLRRAGFPEAPSSPKPLTAGGLALVVGLSLGAGAAYLRDRLDPRLRGRDDLEVHAGAPVIAYIPAGTPLKDGLPVTASDRASELAESYTALGLRIMRAEHEGRLRTVVITSSLSEEGKTSIAANLGVALAQSGKRVVVVSADLRRPGLQSYFAARNGTGLTDVLRGKGRVSEALTETAVRGLWVLPAGGPLNSASPLELLSSDAMRRALEELRRSHDYVLIDTPPLLASFDVTALAGFADGILFVADARKASRTTVEHAGREFKTTGASLIGVVVNRYDPRTFESYGYRYRYGGYQAAPSDDHAALPAGRSQKRKGTRQGESKGPGPR
jgi:capsular exopolysaccharide synthesis family protein